MVNLKRRRRNKLVEAQDKYIENAKKTKAIAEDYGMSVKDAATIAAGGFIETIFDVGSGTNKDEKAKEQANKAFSLGDGAGFL